MRQWASSKIVSTGQRQIFRQQLLQIGLDVARPSLSSSLRETAVIEAAFLAGRLIPLINSAPTLIGAALAEKSAVSLGTLCMTGPGPRCALGQVVRGGRKPPRSCPNTDGPPTMSRKDRQPRCRPVRSPNRSPRCHRRRDRGFQFDLSPPPDGSNFPALSRPVTACSRVPANSSQAAILARQRTVARSRRMRPMGPRSRFRRSGYELTCLSGGSSRWSIERISCCSICIFEFPRNGVRERGKQRTLIQRRIIGWLAWRVVIPNA